ncbi:BrnA antitoxin family protein [Candidatus Daviesbacteria bacterium]|nr:BrnA antitoxin family protein [Candidatus Daviesbacteria bacterium]
MNKKLKPIPGFKSEAEEREFWQTHDSTEYIDWSKAKRGVSFPNLKLTTKPITIRLPAGLIDRVKIKAHKMDVPYQSLIKQFIFEGIAK